MKTKAILSVLVLLAVYCPLTTVHCLSAVPSLINYQGVLKDSDGVPYDGNATMVFSIWSDSTGGTNKWEETQAIVSVSHGLFNVLLGSSNPVPDSVFLKPSAWLQVIANGNQLSPRRRIVSVGYAFHSGFCDTALHALSAPPDDDWMIDTSGFNIFRLTGNVGIGTTSPAEALHVVTSDGSTLYQMQGSNGYGFVIKRDGDVGVVIDRVNNTAGRYSGIHFQSSGLSPGGDWDVATRAGDRHLYFTSMPLGQHVMVLQSGGNVGIGTTNPSEKLDVSGNTHISGNLTVDGSINPFPLKVYDSGWFAVSPDNSYTKTHNLGTVKMLITVYGATASDGANMSTLGTPEGLDGQNKHSTVGQMTTTQFTLRTGIHQLGHIWNGSSWVTATYARIIALALE